MWRQRVHRELHRLRSEGRPALLWSMRITVAAVASYVVGILLFPGTEPLLAPLTAMLVVQVTPVSRWPSPSPSSSRWSGGAWVC